MIKSGILDGGMLFLFFMLEVEIVELNELKETIQEFFQENTVTIVGSGLSAAEDLPGMKDLAKYLIAEMPTLIHDQADIDSWSKISTELATGKGLEAVLLKNAPTDRLEATIQDLTARLVGEAEKKIIEEVMQGKRVLRFSEYMEHFNLRNDGLTVITPNYDRLIEYSCEFNKVRVDTLFVGNYYAHFNPSQSKYMFCRGTTRRNSKLTLVYSPRVTLYKPHGSLGWHMINDEPYSIPNSDYEDSLIITPGLNKYRKGYGSPFDIHHSKANDAIDAAERYIIIGYGFNDDHLETHLVRQLRRRKPTLIISRSLYDKPRDLVKQNKSITALCRGNKDGTEVLTSAEQCFFDDINLWDLHEMLKEVF